MRDISSRLPSLGIPEERPLRRRLPTLAWGLPACAVMLAAIGLTVVRSASTELAVDYLPRQAAWVGVGLLAMLVGFAINHADTAAPGGAALRDRSGGVGAGASLRARGGRRAELDRHRRRSAASPPTLMKLATILLLVRYLGASDHDR